MSQPDSWERVLDGLEADVLEAEGRLRGLTPAEPTPWTPPTGLGPIPAGLVGRARELQQRRREVIVRLEESVRGLRRQRALTARLGAVTGSARRPVYIDRTA